jgi:hypothetical protein
MKTINAYPMRYMRGQAISDFRDRAEIYRNDGYGWVLVGSVRCNIHHRLTPPVPADPTDATGANAEFVEIHLPLDVPVRIGDHIHARNRIWTIGGGNLTETYGTFKRASAARPIAATPLTWITLRRYNHSTNDWDLQAPQLVHVAWSRNQPDRLGGIAVRQFGFIFPPEDDTDSLNVQQGDTFYYGGVDATVQWVPPDPTERREAIFFANIGEGT